MNSQSDHKYRYIFGPVPSRRLGYSLGIDIIPLKTCNLNCVYCELGRTSAETMTRRAYVDSEAVLAELAQVIADSQRIDYLTFSGSGEPTLNSELGELIRRIKATTNIPVAVITNGTLLYLPEVRAALRQADLVMPSLDAASQDVFRRINRPHGHLQIDKIIEGLIDFRGDYSGPIWLEILFVCGINDSTAEVAQLVQAVQQIAPDRVQLNTVARPPAEADIQPLSRQMMQRLCTQFGEQAEIIASFHSTARSSEHNNLGEAILALTARRPVTVADMAMSLGASEKNIRQALPVLLRAGHLTVRKHGRHTYYHMRRDHARTILPDELFVG